MTRSAGSFLLGLYRFYFCLQKLSLFTAGISVYRSHFRALKLFQFTPVFFSQITPGVMCEKKGGVGVNCVNIQYIGALAAKSNYDEHYHNGVTMIISTYTILWPAPMQLCDVHRTTVYGKVENFEIVQLLLN